MAQNTYMKEDKLIEAFKLFDKDGNGKISAEELKDILGSNFFVFLIVIYINR